MRPASDWPVRASRGRAVARPLPSTRPAGAGTVAWNAEGLASGVYLLRLGTAETSEAGKLVLLR